MADTGTSANLTSPYVNVPRHLIPYPKLTSEEHVEDKKEEGTSENPDTNIEIIEDQNNEDGNKEKENELPETDEKDDDENEKKDTEKPLLEEKDSVKIDIAPDNEGEDTPTLPLPDKKRKSKEALEIDDQPESKYIFILKIFLLLKLIAVIVFLN